jgi:hypothetical protein
MLVVACVDESVGNASFDTLQQIDESRIIVRPGIEMQDLRIDSDFKFNTQRSVFIEVLKENEEAMVQVQLFSDAELTRLLVSRHYSDTALKIEVMVPNYSASLSVVWLDHTGVPLGQRDLDIASQSKFQLKL